MTNNFDSLSVYSTFKPFYFRGTMNIPAKKLEKTKEIIKIMIEAEGDRRPVYTDKAKSVKIVYTHISGSKCPVYRNSGCRNTVTLCKHCAHCEYGKKVVHHIEIPKGYLDPDVNLKEAEFEMLFGTEAACWIKIENGELKWVPMFGFGDREPWWKPLTKEEKENITKTWSKALQKLVK